jgi:FtsZ-binding cell division protein ZapB
MLFTFENPIEALLEVAIDLSILLSSLLEEGRKVQRLNPELRFDPDTPDPLGNPAQVKVFNFIEEENPRPKLLIKVPANSYWDPILSDFLFKHLTQFFLSILHHESLSSIFMKLELKGFVANKVFLSSKDLKKEIEELEMKAQVLLKINKELDNAVNTRNSAIINLKQENRDLRSERRYLRKRIRFLEKKLISNFFSFKKRLKR